MQFLINLFFFKSLRFSMEVTGIPSRLIDASLGAGIAAHSARSEVAALQVKLDALERKVRWERTSMASFIMHAI